MANVKKPLPLGFVDMKWIAQQYGFAYHTVRNWCMAGVFGGALHLPGDKRFFYPASLVGEVMEFRGYQKAVAA